jgi:hypothetical protein
MKIGLSLSRCVRDIVEGRVDINDVLLLITRTDFDPYVEDQWQNIWEGYTTLNPEWRGLDYSTVTVVVSQLWDSGRIHQPRKFGAHPQRRREYWLETVLPSSELERNSTVKHAWDQFQIIAGLTGVKLDRDYQ